MNKILVLILSIIIIEYLGKAIAIGTAKLLRIDLSKITFGMGPILYRSKKFDVKLIPIGGSIKPSNGGNENYSKDGSFVDKPSVVKLLFYLCRSLFLLLLSFLILRMDAINSFGSGFWQVINGAIYPIDAGTKYISDISLFLQQSNPIEIFVTAITKYIAISLLPLPGLDGGNALLAIFKPPQKYESKVLVIGVCIFVLGLISWTIAFIASVW